MCYKNLNKNTDKAKEYFYDIINNSGDSDLIRKAANLGLDMVINSAKEAAAKAKEEDSKSSSKSDSSTSKKSSTKSTTEEDFSADTEESNN